MMLPICSLFCVHQCLCRCLYIIMTSAYFITRTSYVLSKVNKSLNIDWVILTAMVGCSIEKRQLCLICEHTQANSWFLLYNQLADFDGIRSRAVGIEGGRADHLSTNRVLLARQLFVWPFPATFFYIFVHSKVNRCVHYKILQMTGFEPRTSAFGSDRSVDWATTLPRKMIYNTNRSMCEWIVFLS